jgi:hypothetical protein
VAEVDGVEKAELAVAPGEALPIERHEAIPRTKEFAGEWVISRALRGGALLSGALFLASLVLELLPQRTATSVLISHLRVAGASVLLVTPIVRLAVGGISLGYNGEWRYLAYALGVLALLAIAIGAGFAA